MAGALFGKKAEETTEQQQAANEQILAAQHTAIISLIEKSAPAKLNAAIQEMKPSDVLKLHDAALADNAKEVRDLLRPQFPNMNDHAQFPTYREWIKTHELEFKRETSDILRSDAQDAIVANDMKLAPAKIKAAYTYDETNGVSVEATTKGIMTAEMAKDQETREFFLSAVQSSGLDAKTVQSIMKYLDKQYNTDIYAQILSGNNKGIPPEVKKHRNDFVESMRKELDQFEKVAAGNPKLERDIETIREGIGDPSQVKEMDKALKDSYATRIELTILDGAEHARLAAIVPKRKTA